MCIMNYTNVYNKFVSGGVVETQKQDAYSRLVEFAHSLLRLVLSC